MVIMSGCDYLPTNKNKAQKAVKNILIDPNSAIFNKVEGGKDSDFVCGFVNSKNRMGGYAGESPFIYNSKSEKIMLLSKFATDTTFRSYFYALRSKNRADALKAMEEIEMACKFPSQWSDKCGGAMIDANDAELCPLYLKAHADEGGTDAAKDDFILALFKRFK
jgi:hypothetical protein